MKKYSVLMGLMLVAAFASAADVDGKWTGTLSVTGQEVPVTYVFKADGATLTGTLSQGGPTIPIKNGKIDGNKISFLLEIQFQGNPMQVNYTGVVSPAEIKLTGEVQGQSFDYVVKKAP
jgi:hypothetical protein